LLLRTRTLRVYNFGIGEFPENEVFVVKQLFVLQSALCFLHALSHQFQVNSRHNQCSHSSIVNLDYFGQISFVYSFLYPDYLLLGEVASFEGSAEEGIVQVLIFFFEFVDVDIGEGGESFFDLQLSRCLNE
jgi:hypothetical protein